MNRNVLRKAVSMTALFSFLYMLFSGVVMYITPPGRIAYWADWRVFGMNKTMYTETHTTMSMLFVISIALHIWLNWSPIMHYMSSRSGKFVFFTKETVFGVLLAAVFIGGTLLATAPFSTVVDTLGKVKDNYEQSLGNPPYPHAELTKLSLFIKRMKFDGAQAYGILDRAKIKYSPEDTLKTIAVKNGTDPKHIYDMLKPSQREGAGGEPVTLYEGVQNGVDMSKYDSLAGSGMGRKSVENAAAKAGIPVSKALERLAKYNIKAEPGMSMKEVAGEAGITPMDIFIIIDSGVKPE